MDIKSKSGPCYRLEFKKNTVKVTCLSAVGVCSFLKTEIYYAMNPLKLKEKETGFETVTYKCPFWKKKAVIKRVREC